MSKIDIDNPNVQPYGPLSNNYPYSMKINNKVWNSVSNYYYANLLIYPNHQDIIQFAPIKSELSEKEYVEKMNKFLLKGKNERSVSLYSSSLEFQGLNLFNKYRRLFDMEFSNIIVEAIRKAYTYLLFETKDSSELQDFLINTGNGDIIYFSENRFFGKQSNGSGFNFVGLVLSELRQGLVIQKKNISIEQAKNRQKQIIKNYIVAYDILLKLVNEGRSLKPYLGSKPIKIIEKYFENETDRIYENLIQQYGEDANNIKNNLGIEIKNKKELLDLSHEERIKALGYNESSLNMYLEDYNNNYYPLLIDIVNSENEPVRKYIANVLNKYYKNEIKTEKERKRNLVIVKNFLADVVSSKFQNKVFSQEDLDSIYNSFYIKRKSDNDFEEKIKRILNDYESGKLKESTKLKIIVALADFDKNMREEEYDEKNSSSQNDDEDNEDDNQNSNDESSSSESSSLESEDEDNEGNEEENKLNSEDWNKFEKIKLNKIFNLDIELKEDKPFHAMSTREQTTFLKKLLSNYTFDNTRRVFQISLNRYKNKNSELETINIGVFGNQEIIQHDFGYLKNFGNKANPISVLTQLKEFIQKPNNEDPYKPIFITDIIIDELIPNTGKDLQTVINSTHKLGLTHHHDIVINGVVYPSCYIYIITFMNHKMCGLNVNLKNIVLNDFKINDTIDNYKFDLETQNTMDLKVKRGMLLSDSIEMFKEDETDFVNPIKADSIFQSNLKRTHEIMSVILLLKGVAVKFKNIELQKILILSRSGNINYYDKQDSFLGKEGSNIMSFILTSLRTDIQSRKITINTASINEQLTSKMNQDWSTHIIQDMCTIVYRMKYFLNSNIDVNFVETVMSNLYNFYRIEQFNIPKYPAFVKYIVQECYGMEFYYPEKEIKQIEQLEKQIEKANDDRRQDRKKIDLFNENVDEKGRSMYFDPTKLFPEYKRNYENIIALENKLYKTEFNPESKRFKRLYKVVMINGKQKKVPIYNEKLRKEDIQKIIDIIGNLTRANIKILENTIHGSEPVVDKHKIFDAKKLELEEKLQRFIDSGASITDIQFEHHKMLDELRKTAEQLFNLNRPVISEEQENLYKKFISSKKEEIKHIKEGIKVKKQIHDRNIEAITMVYWKYLYNLAIHLVKTMRRNNDIDGVTYVDFGKAISNFENPSISNNCEKFFENDDEMNCIANALINILVGIQNIKNKMVISNEISSSNEGLSNLSNDLTLASNILVDLSIKKERQQREKERANKNKNDVVETGKTSVKDMNEKPKEEKKIGIPEKSAIEIEFDQTIFGLDDDDEPDNSGQAFVAEDLIFGENEDDDGDDNDGNMNEDDDEENNEFVFEEYQEENEDGGEPVEFGMRKHPKIASLTNLINTLNTSGKTENEDELSKQFVETVKTIKKLKFPFKNKRINMFVNLFD